jgi:hypothetical protein
MVRDGSAASGVDGGLTAIACPMAGLCVAVDGQGNEVTAS